MRNQKQEVQQGPRVEGTPRRLTYIKPLRTNEGTSSKKGSEGAKGMPAVPHKMNRWQLSCRNANLGIIRTHVKPDLRTATLLNAN